MQTVALIGLGIMGNGMAHNLLRHDFPLVVYNRTQAKTDELKKAGAKVAGTPHEAVKGADVVIVMVANDDASHDVWTGDDGALSGVRSGTILIDSSTLSPTWVRELAGLAEQRGCHFLDAPVTGSKPQAEGGQLNFLVGGDKPVLDQVRPVFEAMGSGIHYFGPSGSGAAMKLINNMMSGVQVAVLAEGLALAERAGLPLDNVVQLLSNGAPGSPIVKGKAPAMVAHDYSTNFALRWMHKDLSYAFAEGERNGMPLSVVAAARDLFGQAMEAGMADDDFSAVAEVARRKG